NLHPLVLYDDSVPGAAETAETVSGAILDLCIAHGGSITGEHGVGVDKSRYLPKMFGADDLDTMQLLRCAFDPAGVCNPGKVFPTPRLCGEVPGPRRAPHPLVASGQGDQFCGAIRNPMLSRRPLPRGGAVGADPVLAALAAACPAARPAQPGDAVAGVMPRFTASPATVAEASELLRAAAAHDLAVVPRGGSSKFGWGAPPRRVDLIVDTSGLDRVVEHAAGDLVVRVQAGVSLAQLGEVLAGAGQQLALDPPPCPAPPN